MLLEHYLKLLSPHVELNSVRQFNAELTRQIFLLPSLLQKILNGFVFNLKPDYIFQTPPAKKKKTETPKKPVAKKATPKKETKKEKKVSPKKAGITSLYL